MQDARGRQNAPALAVASVYVGLTAAAAHLVNRVVTAPYLDEVFHIPQAQRYCRGQWQGYDPKLTTPPGLYIVSVAGARLVQMAQQALPRQAALNSNVGQDAAPCTTVPQLRYTCLLASLAMPWILSIYVRARQESGQTCEADLDTPAHAQIKPTSPMEALVKAESDPAAAARTARSTVAARRMQLMRRKRAGIWGVVGSTLDDVRLTWLVHTMACLPPLWFFGFLYYTDVPSTAFVMSMLAAARSKRHALAALLAIISVSLRQTNIIWVLFAVGESAITMLQHTGLETHPLGKTGIRQQIVSLPQALNSSALVSLLKLFAWYTPIFALGALFLAVNGAIVLGDREHHQVSTHWVQPWYGIAFATFFSWPVLLASLVETLQIGQPITAVKRLLRPIPLLLTLLTSLAAVRLGTVAHPFLLADNRHYAFYLWRRVINPTPWARFALALPYALSARAWWIVLSQRQSIFWLVGFVACLCAAVIPSPLIEPRYFLIPYLIARCELACDGVDQRRKSAQTKKASILPVVLELAWFAVINGASVYLFLERPFRWADTNDWQRFMW